MSSSSARTVITFGIIALVLGGVVVGAVRLTKERSNSYATSHTTNVAQANTQKQTASQPQPQKDNSKSSTSNSSTQSKPTQSSSNSTQSQTPVPSVPSTLAPSSTDKTSATTTDPQQNKLPQTSALSPADLGFTMILVMLAIFFGNKLLRARADYRRYIGS